MALKFVNKSKTKLKNFLREFSITNTLSSSPFIIKVFDVVFETEDCYVFAQEYAPGGDLFDIIPPQVRAVLGAGVETRGLGVPGQSHCARACTLLVAQEGALVFAQPHMRGSHICTRAECRHLDSAAPKSRLGTHCSSPGWPGTHNLSHCWHETHHPSLGCSETHN